jgi:hypothetical protein
MNDLAFKMRKNSKSIIFPRKAAKFARIKSKSDEEFLGVLGVFARTFFGSGLSGLGY